MVSLEQIKLLESKISRAVNFVTQVTEENNRLRKRNDELEEAISALREEKTRVEEGIISALGKLNQFEDAMERSLSSVKNNSRPIQKEPVPQARTPAASPPKPAVEIPKPVTPAAPVQSPGPSFSTPAVKAKPVVPSAYTIEEDSEEASVLDEIEDSGEAELDIF